MQDVGQIITRGGSGTMGDKGPGSKSKGKKPKGSKKK
jgi:hypothetical protein